MKPDFLVIGAPKCGTTWLSRRLAAHPSITMPLGEVHFFSRLWDRGWDWYDERLMAGKDAGEVSGTIVGENSNSYLTEAVALGRIREFLPETKFISILRHPIDRAYSSYGMQLDRGRANRDIDAYLDPERSPRPHILTNGLYADLLTPYFEAFGRDKMHVILFDDIREDPKAVYRDVLAFLGVDRDFIPDNLLERENARKQSGVPGPVKRLLWWLRPAIASGALRPLRQSAIGKTAEALISSKKQYPMLTPNITERLSRFYADDMNQLEQMIGAPLDRWRDRYPSGS